MSNLVKDNKKTGYPSIDKPWLKFYTNQAINTELPELTIFRYLFNSNQDSLNNIALEYLGKKIKFIDLFSRIDSVAKNYTALGVTKEDIVTICMPSTPEAIYSIYALNKIGVTVNLIDPRVSEEMIKDFINEVNSKYLLTINLCSKKIKNIVDKTRLEKIIYVSATNSAPIYIRILKNKNNNIENDKKWIEWNKFIKESKEYSEAKYERDNPAVIVHTGGTTGKPKGVILTNDNVNSIAFQYKNGAIDFNSNQSFLDIIPPFAAYGICSSIHMPLTLGIKVILIPKFNPKDFDKLIIKYKPTHITGVPSFWESLSKSTKMKNKDLSFLKTPACGGDGILPTQENNINDFLKKHNCPSNLIKGYGMSEVSSSACTCVDNCNEISSVGIPLLKMTISIFEPETTNELKYNQEGEICITGIGVMKEYYNNEELTKKTLVRHSDGNIWVHTGDLGYMTENGVLYITGRIKRMIVRYDGFKIYPTSIENVILECNGIDSVAVVKSKSDLGNVAKAYMVAKNNVKDLKELESKVINKCTELLAERAVPAEFEFVDELPKTNLGKIDYKKLEESE